MRSDWKLLVLAVCWCTLGCADFKRGPAPPDAGAADAAPIVDPVFEDEVYPILQYNCQYCHKAGRTAEDTQLVLTGKARTDRAMVLGLVVPGDPTASLLLLRAGGEEHWGGEILTPGSPDYEVLAEWIANLPAGP